MTEAFRLAIGTLTIIPTVGPQQVTRRIAGRAMIIAPFAVLPVAVVAVMIGRLSSLADWPALVDGLLVIAVLAAGTRALHLDGLADTVDGFGSGTDRQWALAVMRRGDIGPMGTVVLIVVLGLQAAAASALTARWLDGVLLVVIICGSRAALSLACRRGVPAARPDGLGSAVAGSVPVVAAVVGCLLTAGVIIGVGVVTGSRWWGVGLAVLLAGVAVLALVRSSVRRLGGITGDVLGACVEVALTILLLGAVS